MQHGLPPLLTLGHLAASAEVDYPLVQEIVERRGRMRTYTVFNIRKRSGGLREIAVPSYELLRLQRWIHKSILEKIPVHGAAHAFVKGRGIRTMASVHCGCRWLIRIDLRDFFGSLRERQAYDFFHRYGYSRLVSFEMARICTYVPEGSDTRLAGPESPHAKLAHPRCSQGVLPQGGASSPALSNHLVRRLDTELLRRAARYGVVYSRYADDLAFSTTAGEFSRRDAAALIREVQALVVSHGLRVNPLKTHVAGPGARRAVVGLLVDSAQPRLSRRLRSALQVHLHYLEERGLAAHAQSRGFSSAFGLFRYLDGLIAFVTDIEPKEGHRMRAILDCAALKMGLV